MSEHLDRHLAGLAGAVADATAVPDPSRVRRRGRQRTLHRRAAASVLTVALLAGGAVSAAAAIHLTGGQTPLQIGQTGRTGSPPTEAGSTGPAVPLPGSTTAPTPTSTPPPSTPSTTVGQPQPGTSATRDSGSPLNSPLVGIWTATSQVSGRVIVYPDGKVGLSTQGGWQLCAGTLGQRTGATYPVTLATTGCVAYVDTGFTLAVNADHSVLTLTTRTSDGSTYPETFGRTGTGPGSPTYAAPTALLGTWRTYSSDNSILTISSDGTVDSTHIGQSGQSITGHGSVQLLSDGTFRFTLVSGADPSTTGLLQGSFDPGGATFTVITSSGEQTFTRSS